MSASEPKEYGTPTSLPSHKWEITFEDREGTWTWIRCEGSFHGVILVALAAAFERGQVIHHVEQLDKWSAATQAVGQCGSGATGT